MSKYNTTWQDARDLARAVAQGAEVKEEQVSPRSAAPAPSPVARTTGSAKVQPAPETALDSQPQAQLQLPTSSPDMRQGVCGPVLMGFDPSSPLE